MRAQEAKSEAQRACIESGQTAPVKVYQPCSCAVCASGARWFMCPQIGSRFVIEYMCDPLGPDSHDTPHPAQVRAIAADHPGCDLVYLD